MSFSRKYKFTFVILLICIMPYCALAQDNENKDIRKWFSMEWVGKIFKERNHNTQYSVGTNLLNWVYFGTSNLELNASLNNRYSVFAGAKYNFLKFHTKGKVDVFNNHKTAYAGIKWWPWFVNTGWWAGLKGQYSDFSTSGVITSSMREGVAVGVGLSGGYSFMLGRHFNLDLGVGVWGGSYLKYTDYEKDAKQQDTFFKIDNIAVSIIYIF